MEDYKSSIEELMAFRDKSAIWADILDFLVNSLALVNRELSIETDPIKMYRKQGAIEELNRLICLLDIMIDDLEETNKEKEEEEKNEIL